MRTQTGTQKKNIMISGAFLLTMGRRRGGRKGKGGGEGRRKGKGGGEKRKGEEGEGEEGGRGRGMARGERERRDRPVRRRVVIS